ncbi:MAG: hypothetical protein E7548_02940 [Ruminococcaceae bacterium]|nr:hypothetical protein [Oscillospiraceae bacterium]
MRKLLILTFLIAIVFCGCSSQASSTSSQSTVSVILPDAETATTVNGYLNRGESNSESKFNIQYFANKNTKKFHISTCRWAKSIKDENLYKSYNRELLISDGYEPCKTCKP